MKSSDREKDLGMLVESNGKFSEQCSAVMNKANLVLGIPCKSRNIILQHYKALVRPKLDYFIQAQSPYLKKDIDNLEKINTW